MSWLSSGGFGLVAHPALNHVVGVEFNTNHSLITATRERLVGATLKTIKLRLLNFWLQAVSEVSSEFCPPLWQFDYNCLVVNHCPSSLLTRNGAFVSNEHFNCVVWSQIKIKVASVPRQSEFEVFRNNLKSKTRRG